MAFERPAFTATPFLHIDGLLISSETGEIFGYDDKSSVFYERPDHQPELSKCRSADDLSAFLKHIDRRKLPLHTLHSLVESQDIAHGVWRRTGLDCRITLPMMNILRKLHGLVQYHNVIIMPQADLAKALNTTESNLMKKLNTLVDANMVRVSTSRQSKIRKGEVKLTINPRLIFRGDDYAQERYMKDWYLNLSIDTSSSAETTFRIAA
jgi:DNA-binding MarR family transcriptional regulator